MTTILRVLASIAVLAGLLACNASPTEPSSRFPALGDTVHAQSVPNILELRGAAGVILISDAGADLFWNGESLRPSAQRVTLGTAVQPWGGLYLASLAGAGANRYVCHDDAGRVYSSKTSCDGGIEALRAEIADLRRGGR